MVKVEPSESGMSKIVEQATYAYDSRGLRIQKTSRTGRYKYSYGLDGNVLSERRRLATGEELRLDFVYAFGQLLGWTERMLDEQTGDYSAASAYWAASDHLGSVSMATDRNGQVVMRRDYSAFGQAQDEQTGMGTALGPRYTGKDWDEDAGLYYFNARWYDPELGRFTTEDPIRDGGNWYVYVNNRPLNLVDPSGLIPKAGAGSGDDLKSEKETARNSVKKGKERAEKSEKEKQEKEIEAAEERKWGLLVDKEYNQLEFDNRYGFSGDNGETQSCQTVSLINIYINHMDGMITQQNLDNIVKDWRSQGVIRSDGSPKDLNEMSKTISRVLGLDEYYVLNYEAPDWLAEELSPSDFSSSAYTVGIEERKTEKGTTHYTASVTINGRRVTVDSLDPNRPEAALYTVKRIKPMRLIKRK